MDKGKQQNLYTHTRKQDVFCILQINEKRQEKHENIIWKSKQETYAQIG